MKRRARQPGWSVLLLAGWLLACSGGPLPTPTIDLQAKADEMMRAAATQEALLPTATPVLSPTPAPSRTPIPTRPPAPTLKPVVGSPSPVAAAPSPTAPIKPVAAPASVTFTARAEPATVLPGGSFNLILQLTNGSQRPLTGFGVSASGPWQKLTLTQVPAPAHVHGPTEAGFLFHLTGRIEPGEMSTIQAIFTGREPGRHTLRLIAFEEHEGPLVRADGSPPEVSLTITVAEPTPTPTPTITPTTTPTEAPAPTALLPTVATPTELPPPTVAPPPTVPATPTPISKPAAPSPPASPKPAAP